MSEGLKGGAAHYRLSGETWAIILDEYRDGATVPELSERWRVSRHALRKRITVHGATKRDWGDARAQAQARAREQAQAERAQAEAARAEALFADPAEGEGGHEAEDAATLADLAMRASARAMRGRMWDEARTLAQLAEAYGRMAQRDARTRGLGEVTLEDVPLELVAALALNTDECATNRLAIWGDDRPDPVKKAFWRIKGQRDREAMARWQGLNLDLRRAERRVAELEQRLGPAPGEGAEPEPPGGRPDATP